MRQSLAVPEIGSNGHHDGTPPPYNLEAEQSTIGAMLMERAAVEAATAQLAPRDFYQQTHRIIFDCITAMHRRGDETDYISVSEELRRHDQLGDDEGQVSAAYLKACWEACPAASTVNAHAKIVRELSQKRRAAYLADSAHSYALNGVGAGVALAEIRKSLESLEAEVESATTRRRFAFTTLSELAARPKPEMLIGRVLTCAGTSLLTAKHASFKSFFALDMALCVATGTAWQGETVKRGPVVYVAAEGAGGLEKRVRAWMMHHDHSDYPSDFHVLDEPARIADAGVLTPFIEAVSELRPALIVLDTLARCAVGLDENSARDMGLFVEATRELAAATGAHVLIVHHNNKGGEFRGSTAIAAAVDTHMSLERNGQGDTATLKFEKQKDFEELPPLGFTRRIIELNSGGREHSLVFERDDTADGGQWTLSNLEQRALESLEQIASAGGVTSSAWKATCEDKGVKGGAFYRCQKRLIDLKSVGVVMGEHGKRGALYAPVLPVSTITPTLPNAPTGSNGSVPHYHSHAPTLLKEWERGSVGSDEDVESDSTAKAWERGSDEDVESDPDNEVGEI